MDLIGWWCPGFPFNLPKINKPGAHWAVMNPSSSHQLLPCRMEERCSGVVTNTHIHLLMGGFLSSSPLNRHWGLTLVWTLRGCLQEADRPEPDVSPFSPSHYLTPSFAFHTAAGNRLLPSKTCHHIDHIHTAIYLPEREPTVISPGTSACSLLPQKFARHLPLRDPEQCWKYMFSSGGDDAHSRK